MVLLMEMAIYIQKTHGDRKGLHRLMCIQTNIPQAVRNVYLSVKYTTVKEWLPKQYPPPPQPHHQSCQALLQGKFPTWLVLSYYCILICYVEPIKRCYFPQGNDLNCIFVQTFCPNYALLTEAPLTNSLFCQKYFWRDSNLKVQIRESLTPDILLKIHCTQKDAKYCPLTCLSVTSRNFGLQ